MLDSQRDPAGLSLPIREAIWSVDRALPADAISTLESLVANSMADQRYRMSLLAAFGVIALVISAVGVAGMTVRSVSMRYHELGIRAALGADGASLVALVLRQQTVTIGLGLVLGCATAALAGGFLARFLYGVTPRDPVSFLAAATLLAVVGVGACLVPARRAASIDPVTALRAQ